MADSNERDRKLAQEQLSLLSDANIRSIRSYEQGEKAHGDTLQMLAKPQECKIEE